METDDAVYARACREGDANAFGALYDRYIERIYSFVYYKTFSKEIAEDIVSTVFLKAYERLGSFDTRRGNFSQWIYSIARNAVVDHYRTRKVHADVEDIFDLGENERTEEKIDARDLLEKIEKHVRTLKPREREVVLLRVWEGRSYDEIAEMVGGTPASVKMVFSRAIRDIRAKFGASATLVFLTSRFFN